MPRFAFTALDRAGAARSSVIESPDVASAVERLRAEGWFPTALRPVADAAGSSAAGDDHSASADHRPTDATSSHPAACGPADASVVSPSRRSVARSSRRPFVFGRIASAAELALFARQLSTLLHAGLPLVRALQVLARQQRNAAFRWTLDAVIEAVAGGRDFSSALREHPRGFPPLFASLARAGEASGRLDDVLGQLARLLEKMERLKNRVRAALFYPVVVLAVTLAIVAALLVFVVPKFRAIFADLLRGAPLPPLTRAVLAASDAVREHLGLFAFGLAAAAVGLAWLRRTPAWDRATLRVPVFGELRRKSAVARGSRALATLLGGGVPILQALLIAKETIGHAVLAGALARAHDRVREGQPLSAPLIASRAFPAMATSMIEVGEETGELPAMLARVADTYDDEVEQAAAGLTSVIEPVMIVLLAMLVGTVVLALFLPIVRILQTLSGG